MKLSQKYADLHAELAVSVLYLGTVGTIGRLQILPAKLAAIVLDQTNYEIIYAKYIDPSTHQVSVGDMKTNYDSTHSETEGLKKVLKANQDITLTSLDYQKIHIHEDEAHRHKVPAPVISPVTKPIKTSHLVVKMFSSNPTVGEEADKHLPVDVKRVGRKVAVVNHGDPLPPASAYVGLANIGATTYDVVFTPEQAHKQGYIITWYISPTGETGPESDPSSFDII